MTIDFYASSYIYFSVDISSQPRSRKLKKTADEAIITGASYSKRLRLQ